MLFDYLGLWGETTMKYSTDQNAVCEAHLGYLGLWEERSSEIQYWAQCILWSTPWLLGAVGRDNHEIQYWSQCSLWSTPWLLGAVGRDNHEIQYWSQRSLWSTPWLLGAVVRENQWNTVLITVQSVKHTLVTWGCGEREPTSEIQYWAQCILWSTPWLFGVVGRENQWNTVLITVQSVKHTMVTWGCGEREPVKYSTDHSAVCEAHLGYLGLWGERTTEIRYWSQCSLWSTPWLLQVVEWENK